ncbi:MAG: NPCBM/NEW2 domain-containing protein [Pirellulaceae bacterium]
MPDDPNYKWNKVEQDQRTWFRPSDVAVGTDGAIYVADWFDPIVGGHAMQDLEGSGTIYRIAPKGQTLPAPKIDVTTLDGQIAALKSPAPNVRFLGFEKLRARGEKVLAEVSALRNDDNPYVRARMVWLMAQLGDAGRRAVVKLLDHDDPSARIVAFRALLRTNMDLLAHATRLAADPSPAVRREVALAMRDVPLEACQDILVKLAEGYDAQDRWYLEALGTACGGKEESLFPRLLDEFGALPTEWDERFAGLVWRLHPANAIGALSTRALCEDLTVQQRKQATDSLAFIEDAAAAEAMIEIALRGPGDLRAAAAWWIGFRANNLWCDYPAVLEYSRSAKSMPTEVAGVRLPGRPVYTSDVIRRGDVADILVDITGAQRLYLVVTDAGDGNSCDWADWVEPHLLDSNGETKLTDLDWDRATTSNGSVLVDKNSEGLPLRVSDRPVSYGIGTHASSVIAYDIADRGFQWFAARGGLDNSREDLGEPDCSEANLGVVFHVYHDGPTPESRAQVNEAVMLDSKADLPSREAAALAMARSGVGGMRLLGLASQGKLPEDLRDCIGNHIHLNPDLSVRALAGQYFSRLAADGKSLPAMAELLRLSGDAAHGKELVLGRAQCATCHLFAGQGKSVGPDLTDVERKLDRTRLFDSVLNPSASIAFGYETWLIQTDEGQVITGFVIGEGDPVVLVDAKGEQHSIPAESIEFRQRQSVSIMPEMVGRESEFTGPGGHYRVSRITADRSRVRQLETHRELSCIFIRFGVELGRTT